MSVRPTGRLGYLRGRLGRGPFSSIARSPWSRTTWASPLTADETRDAGFCVAMIDDEGSGRSSRLRAPKDHFDTQTCCRSMYGSGDYVLLSGYNVMYPGSAEVLSSGWRR